jgi:hypothetical protein
MLLGILVQLLCFFESKLAVKVEEYRQLPEFSNGS